MNKVHFLHSLQRRTSLVCILIFCAGALAAQNCDVDFPGTSNQLFSGSCGSSASNLTLGKTTYMGDGDTFTFDLPVVNITGNISVNAVGNAKIIIPAGVVVNISGNFQLDQKNSGCSSTNPCVFEIEVHGTIRFANNVQNNLAKVVWSGSGSVTIAKNFENSSNGCMDCGNGGCPTFDVKQSCSDNGNDCSGDFCDAILNPCDSDAIKPTIAGCPSNIVATLSASGCSQIVTWTAPTAQDNCQITSLTPSHAPGTAFSRGTTLVTYTAVDAAGNSSTCSFTVTVNDPVKPVISECPPDQTINLTGTGCTQAVNWTPPTATDNCTLTSFTSTHAPGAAFPKGATTVTYTAKDASGNTATCSFTVTVNDPVKPVISGCPPDQTINLTGTGCTQAVHWTPPTATDNCTLTSFTSTHAPGAAFPKGATTVTYTAKDASGNSSTCSFTVTVNDPVKPVISGCPADQVISLSGAECTTIVSWTPPTATDNCSISEFTSTHAPGTAFAKGSTTVTYSAVDASGNVSTCSFDVVVQDETPPVFISCARDLTISNYDPVLQRAAVLWTQPEARDNCDLPVITCTSVSGDYFEKGRTVVTCTAVDLSGNKSTCDFAVTITGNRPPSASSSNLTAVSGEPLQVCLEITDPDGDHAFIKGIQNSGENGTVEDLQEQCFTYTSARGFVGIEVLSAQVCDDQDPQACAVASIQVNVISEPPLEVFKALTPNNDGHNDTWYVKGIERFPSNNVTIFDRWGGQIYKAKGYDNTTVFWDGRNGGTLAPSGTYYYTIELNNGKAVYRGYVELVN